MVGSHDAHNYAFYFGDIYMGAIHIASGIISAFSSLDVNVAVALVTASGTIFAATCAVVIGRYLESRSQRNALHRDKKIDMYDEFLRELFDIFAGGKLKGESTDGVGDDNKLVEFLRESQRKFTLWSGPKVIRTYADWIRVLRATGAEPTAKTVLKMEEFLFSVRSDLGHTNRGLKRGDIMGFILRHIDIFLEESNKNPDITLSALAKIEKERVGEE